MFPEGFLMIEGSWQGPLNSVTVPAKSPGGGGVCVGCVVCVCVNSAEHLPKVVEGIWFPEEGQESLFSFGQKS